MADTKEKSAARTRQAETGERYTEALQHVREDETIRKAEAIKKRRAEGDRAARDAVGERIRQVFRGTGEPFTDPELRFAAFSRCACGAGLAYPTGGPFRGSWDCSSILKGTAIHAGQAGAVEHTGRMPFAFWKVKSEGQPSAGGATTRPE